MNEYLVISRGRFDADASPDSVQGAVDRFYAWIDRNVAAGRMRSGSRLRPELRIVSRTSITDGPFAETKEIIGGYWFIMADSLDEAAALAAENPCKDFGLIFEIRPLDPEKFHVDTLANETPASWR